MPAQLGVPVLQASLVLPLMPTDSPRIRMSTVRFNDDPEVIDSTEQQKRQRTQVSSSSSSSNRPPPSNSAATGKADKPQGWWIHGHRVHNFHLHGITQENATRGRTRGGLGRGRESPQQEQNRLENPHLTGPVPAQIGKEEKKKRKEDTFPMEQMTCLMDSLWEKRKKWGNHHPNFWAMANQISFKYRPSYHQVEKYKWDDASRNPYPGWKVAIGHTPSGWKVGIMTDSEHTEWVNEHSQPFSKAAQARQRELHAAAAAAAVAVAVADTTPTEEDEDPQAITVPATGILTTKNDSTAGICPYEVAMHRWHLFSEAACKELKRDFRPEVLDEIRKYFDASSFRLNRNDLAALQQDILQCQHLREILVFNTGGQSDFDTAFKRKKTGKYL